MEAALTVISLDNLSIKAPRALDRASHEWMLRVAEKINATMERGKPEMERALVDLSVYGYAMLRVEGA
jgi:hypothetical protein